MNPKYKSIAMKSASVYANLPKGEKTFKKQLETFFEHMDTEA